MVDYGITATLAVDDVEKEKNYCRQRADSTWNVPSCVIAGELMNQLEEPCEISRCGKSNWILIVICD